MSKQIQDAYIVASTRTPVGKAPRGAFRNAHPADLLAHVLKSVVAQAPGIDTRRIDDIIIGCAMPEGEQGMNVARIGALLAGLPDSIAAQTINRFCSSGLQAVALAADRIRLGESDLMIAGGVESMSMVPMTGNKLSVSPEAMERVASVYTPMGITAENVASKFGITREQQDAFALDSQKKASNAIEKKIFDKEIVPVTGIRYVGNERKTFEFKVDELPRPETTAEGLASLKPAFSTKGSVTAGNSSPLSDGAAAALVMSGEKAKSLGLKGIGYLRAYVTVGVDPALMGIGPLPAIQKLLAKTGLKISDIDLFEVNEAFACQAFYTTRELGIPADRLNVNGGAIALGHPLGCTGAKLTAQLLYELGRRGGKYGIVSMCIGGGMGAAGLFERIN
jgi:acetyl-CoA acyltransferase